MRLLIIGQYKYSYIELDLNSYTVNYPEYHRLWDEDKYQKLFNFSGYTPSISKDKFDEMMEEWEERTIKGI